METLIYNNYEYKITENYKLNSFYSDNDIEISETDKTIIREKFAIIPIFFKNKYYWLKKVRIRYKLYFSRKLEFDDGWSYQFFWTKWKPEWEIIDIIKI